MADLIETLLTQLNLKTVFFHRGSHCGDWQLIEEFDKVLFHFVSNGNCMVEIMDNGDIIKLSKGDLILFPRPKNHILRALNFNQNKTLDNSTGLICAFVEFQMSHQNTLFEALPDYVITKSNDHPNENWLKNLLDVLFSESKSDNVASQTLVERLTDILFIHIIRSYLSRCPERTGIIAAYKDPYLQQVLESMHENPQKPWTISDFSEIANLSRSAFIKKFSSALEMPPMTFLTELRLQYAYRQLFEGKRKILDIAKDCGYENESSFSKAFKRKYNVSPGLVKQHI